MDFVSDIVTTNGIILGQEPRRDQETVPVPDRLTPKLRVTGSGRENTYTSGLATKEMIKRTMASHWSS